MIMLDQGLKTTEIEVLEQDLQVQEVRYKDLIQTSITDQIISIVVELFQDLKVEALADHLHLQEVLHQIEVAVILVVEDNK